MTSRRILIVDDADSIREALAEALDAHGFAVSCARDGVEAFDVIHRAGKPDLILLDLLMPRMNGWEVMEELADDDELRAIPVVVITAEDQARTQVAAVRKPIVLEELLERIEQLLREERIEPALRELPGS